MSHLYKENERTLHGCTDRPSRHIEKEVRHVRHCQKLVSTVCMIIAFLIVILWNLGAGLYYLLVDKGQSKRTVNALTRRIAFSVALILLVALGIYTGVIKPHGIGG